LPEFKKRPNAREVMRRSGVSRGRSDAGAVGAPESAVAGSTEREFTVEARSQGRMIVRRFLRHRLAMISLMIFLFLVLVSFVGGRIWHYKYTQIFPASESNRSPYWKHPFGTDEAGYDTLAQTLRGMQKSVQIALMVAFLSTSIGVVVGSISGYLRGWVDSVLMRFVDIVLMIPSIAIAATLSRNVQGGDWWLLAVILALTTWTATARIVRGEFLSLREKEFVEAARALGATNRRIIFKHMLPNAMGSIIVNATLIVAGAMLAETALSYLGLGVKPPDTSLGLMVSLKQNAFRTRPWLFWFPGVSILLIALTINFIGDGLRDAFDPKQNRVRS
jgi:ABC-type dipeptide/oligopeptide/nickel transport system permease subunit